MGACYSGRKKRWHKGQTKQFSEILLANTSEGAVPFAEKPSEAIIPQRVNLVAGAGFGPAIRGGGL